MSEASRRVPVLGDEPKLGDTVGHPLEPSIRYARLVGIYWHRKGAIPVMRYIVRRFQPDDTWDPTGEFCQTWMLVPWHKGENDD